MESILRYMLLIHDQRLQLTNRKDLFNISIVSQIQWNLIESIEDFYLSLLLLRCFSWSEKKQSKVSETFTLSHNKVCNQKSYIQTSSIKFFQGQIISAKLSISV